MSQVTIYLEPETLDVAKAAAARAHLSVSKWFAQLVEAEHARTKPGSLLAALDEIDRVHGTAGRDDLDFLLDPAIRYAGLGTDTPREPL
jgi:hypothetical protein